MNTDIRISTSFLNHRKRKKLRHILGPGSTDYLIDLWINTAINRPKGVLFDMDKTDIALDSGWDGEVDILIKAFLEVGFIDFDGEWYKLHDWDKHQAYAMHSEERSEQARNAVSVRWAKRKNNSENTGSIPAVDIENTESNTPSPTPTPNPKPEIKDIKSTVEKPPVLNGSVEDIFTYWKTQLNHPRAKMDDKRSKKIKALLKIGYSVEDLKTAIDGCKKSPWHQGQNNRKSVYDDIELICRDASHVDRFIKTASLSGDINTLSEHGQRAVSVAQSWLEKSNGK